MVVNKNVLSDYQLIKPEGSGGKLRYGGKNHHNDSTSSFTKSPGPGISKRTWSPGQAVLFKRKKVDGESELTESFDALTLTNLHDHIDHDDEEEDYLVKALNNTKGVRRSGRRPTKPLSMKAKSKPAYPIRPMKSKSLGSPRDYPPAVTMRKPSLTEKMMEEKNNCDSSSTATGETSLESSDRSTSPPRSSRGRGGRSKSPAAHNYKNRSKSRNRSRPKSRDRTRPKMDQRDLPVEVQQRLYRITDPNISIKKKVELELEFMKGTQEEKRIYLEFRNHFDRNEFLEWKVMDERQKRDNIEANAREESLKEAAFQRSVERKHQKERQKKKEQLERERQAEEQARMHSLSTIANSMTEIKEAALEAATVSVARNQFEKKRWDDDIRQKVEDFRQGDGKNMTDVQRALKEAIIEQEDPEEKRMRLGPSRRS